MVDLYVEEIMMQVSPEDDREKRLMDSILSKVTVYDDAKFYFRKKYYMEKTNNTYMQKKMNSTDGKIKLYKKQGNFFYTYTGFLQSLRRLFVYLDIPYNIQERMKDTVKTEHEIEYNRYSLYDYQQELFDCVIENEGRGIISSPTGSGKTILGTEIIRHYRTPTIVIADRIKIINEWISKLTTERKSNIEFKEIGSTNIGYIDDEPVIMICTSIYIAGYMRDRREKRKNTHSDIKFFFRNTGLIIYDEVHRAGSDSAVITLNSIFARYRVGLSATPLKRSKKDDLEYVARIGTMIGHVDRDDLVEEEKVVPVKVKFYPVRRKPSSRLKYQEAYENCITFNHDRNEKIVDRTVELFDKGKKFIVFVDRIDHAIELHGMTGIPYTSGSDSESDKKFNDLKEGKINSIICTYQMAGEGFDAPSIDAIISAGAGKSQIKFIQAKGRTTRIFDGKKYGLVIDFADTSKYFDEHAMQRYKLYRGQLGVEVDAKGTWLEGK